MLATSRLIPNCSNLPQYFNIYIFIIRIERKFNYLFLNKIYIYFLSCITKNCALSGLPGAGSGAEAVIENPAPAPGCPKKAAPAPHPCFKVLMWQNWSSNMWQHLIMNYYYIIYC